MSGAGLPCATSAVLKTAAGENQRSKSVRCNFHRISSGKLLDATHLASASRGSTVSSAAMARQASTSLSTSTPSQSKTMRSMPGDAAARLVLGINVDGNAGIVFGRADGQRRAHMRHIGRCRQLCREEALIVVPVGGDDL